MEIEWVHRRNTMTGSIILSFVSTVALSIQFLIFIYLYSSHRVRFFRYLVWAWGLFVAWKALSLTPQFFPEASGVGGLMNAAGATGDLLVLASGLAFRWDYRIRWHHAALGAAYAVIAAAFGHPSEAGMGVPTSSGALVGGGALIAGGLAFWPRRSMPTPPRGARFLATSLSLWGLHRIITPFVYAPQGTGAFVAVNVTFVLFYFLTVFAIIIVVLDRARGEVASLKEFNERLVDGIGEGLQLVGGDFIVRHTNRWMTQQFDSVVGRRCYAALTRDAQPCPGCPLARRHEMETPVRLEVAGSGDRRFLLTCSPVRQPDGQIFLLELVADVTEQERLRARLTEAERLAAAGELAAGVAHEIRNPLAAIVNATTLLEREETLTAEERAGTLEAVKKEARRLNATLSDFLSFARLREPKRLMGDIREVVGRVASLLREERPRAAGVQLEVRVDPSVPLFAFDPDQLTQVLWNIALNGVDAMEGRGHLSLEVVRQNGELLIAVSDTGPGIPLEEQRRIFQPFFSKRPGGTGLGLAIARRIVSAHGGRIELESSPGQGSRFTICLPLKDE
jgi:signal transduction histidine kinase